MQRWLQQVKCALAVTCAMAWVAGFVVLTDDATRIVGHRLALDAPEWRVLLTHTRFGQVWLAKQLVLGVLTARAILGCAHQQSLGYDSAGLAAAFLVIGLWAGHGGATAPLALNLPLHALHALAAAAWLGGLPLWTWLVWRAERSPAGSAYFGRAIMRFSVLAGAMIAILLVTGALIAWQQFARWPALFATLAGGLLALKLLLLSLALSMAWRLRQKYLAALTTTDEILLRRAALRLILVELLAAFGVFGVALALTRMPPGAHQAITWWLPFRIAPGAAWADPLARWLAVSGAALALCALPAGFSRQWRMAAGLAGIGLAILGFALAVPAFPTTYRQPTSAYSASAISAGAALFSTYCTSCHGHGARGDDRPAAGGPIAPDLSEHTALHTAGDMFWWLTHGTPAGNMPAFATVLGEDERWNLINFLRAFADGHRARVLSPSIVPSQPWLGAPNFGYETASGESNELKDYRDRQPVLLVLASLPESVARLRDLARQAADLRVQDLVVLVVLLRGHCDALPSASATSCMTLGGADVAAAYRLLARTLADPGSRQSIAPAVTHAEFLIDRFGYLRARWNEQSAAGWAAQETLLAALDALATEDRIRASPDEHVH